MPRTKGPEKGAVKVVTLQLEPELHKKLKLASVLAGKTIGRVITEALRAYLVVEAEKGE